MDKRCGNCRYFIPEEKLPDDMVVRAREKNRNLWPTCQADGKQKGENDKPCLIWMPKKQGKREAELKSGTGVMN